jgi:hypothetical protein
MRSVAEDLAYWLESNPRSKLDLEAAEMIRKLERVYAAAYDMVHARNDVSSRAAYSELKDLIRGKRYE